MQICFLRAWPRDAASAAEYQIRLAGGGTARAFHLGGLHYRAGLFEFPRFTATIGVDETGFTGRTLPASAQIDVIPNDVALRDQMLALHWRAARLEIDAADEEVAIPPRLLTGIVDDISYADSRFRLRIADGSQRFDKNVLGKPFAGTGGIEGYSGAAGRPKRRSWGDCWNIEGRLLDQANNIWEFGDPAYPLNAFTSLKDMGRAGTLAIIGWQGSIAATLTALQASTPAHGGGCAAPSIACAKWWTQPAGPLTADIQGEIGTGYVNNAPAIASRIVELAGGAPISNLATAIGWRSGAAGWHVDRENASWAEALDAICLGVSLLWIVNPDGTVTLRQCSFDDPAPAVKAIYLSRERTLPPTSTRKLTYKRNNRQHNDGEISAAVLANDVTYADGTPVEALKPAEPGATLGATYGTNVGGLPVAIQPGNILGGGKIDAGQVLYSGGGPTVVSLQPAEAGATLGARAGTNLVDSGGVTLGDGAIKNLAISIGSNGALAGAGGGQVTIGGLGYNGDLSATAGDNMIRNAALATSATDWVVTMGTATRVTSTTAGDQPAYMRATGSANLIALNGGGTGTSAIAVRGGTRLFLSWLARADVANVTGGGANARRCYVRVTYYNAAGSYIGIADISDAAKAATNGEAGGCSPNWELHSGFADAPAAAAFAQIAIFPVLGSTGAGKFIDVAKPVLTVAQAGADRTVDQLQAQQIQPRATVGDNLMRNGDFFTGSDMWWTSPAGGYATADLAWRSGAAENVPGWLRYTAPAAGTARATYTPTRFDRAAPFNKDDGIPVIPGKEYWLQFVYRSDGDIQFGCDAWFYNGATQIAAAQAFIGGPFAPGGATFTANTGGALVRAAIAKITVPAGSNIVFLRHTFARPGGSGATYGEISLVTLTAAEPGATVGARSGVNLVDSGGAALGDSSIKNLAISIGSNGALTGAGGGQVTIGGLGYTGALDADKFAGSAADTKLTGIESGADVTKNAAVSIAPPPPQIIQRDWQGTPKSGQFNRVVTPVVTKGGASIRTDNATTYSITTSGVTATVNNTNGSADKGRITMTAGGPGSISLTVTRDSIAYGPYAIPVTVEDDAPPSNGGSGGGTDSTLEDANSTSFVQMTSADSGEAVFEATITAGQKLKGVAPLTYNWSHNSSSGTNKLVAKWQYSSDGGSTWNDFDTAITGSDASWSAVDLSGEPGSITVNQEKSGLSAGTYKARLVGAKNSSSGNAITIATGAATLSVTS